MTEARQRAAWERAAEIVAAVVNFGYHRPDKLIAPADVHPLLRTDDDAADEAVTTPKDFVNTFATALMGRPIDG